MAGNSTTVSHQLGHAPSCQHLNWWLTSTTPCCRHECTKSILGDQCRPLDPADENQSLPLSLLRRCGGEDHCNGQPSARPRPFSPALGIVEQLSRHYAVAMRLTTCILGDQCWRFGPTAENQSLPLAFLCQCGEKLHYNGQSSARPRPISPALETAGQQSRHMLSP